MGKRVLFIDKFRQRFAVVGNAIAKWRCAIAESEPLASEIPSTLLAV
jgi:hypothetical protein